MRYKVDNYRYTPNTIEDKANDFAFMYSKAFSTVTDQSKNNTSKSASREGYFKVTSENGKSIYLKYMGWNGVLENEIWLTYHNKCALDVKPGDFVEVTKSSAWKFYWYNWDSGVRLPFRFAFWGIVATVLTGLISIVITILK